MSEEEISRLFEEYRNELDTLYKKFRISRIATHEDIPEYADPANYPIKVGETISEFPEPPTNITDANRLFFDFYAKANFIQNKFTHLTNYQTWDLDSIELEISQIEQSIDVARRTYVNLNAIFDDSFLYRTHSVNIEYLRLTNKYYESTLMTKMQLNMSSNAAWAQGRLVMFYDFLKNERAVLLAKDEITTVSDFSSTEHIDTILRWFSINTKHNSYTIPEIRKSLLVNEKFDIPTSILLSILKKLEEDKHIRSHEVDVVMLMFQSANPANCVKDFRYQITWNGSNFINTENNGYTGELLIRKAFSARQDMEDRRHNNDYQRNIYLFWITALIGLSTGVAAVYYLFQLYDGSPIAHPCAVNYTLLICAFIIILLVLVAPKSQPKRLNS